jgi:hypothetical protein
MRRDIDWRAKLQPDTTDNPVPHDPWPGSNATDATGDGWGSQEVDDAGLEAHDAAHEAEAVAVEEQLEHNRQVRDYLEYLKIRRDATQLLRAEAELDPPQMVTLPDFLAVPDEDVTWRVDGLWPVGGRVVFAAQRKAGKSTAVGNLVRSLVNGDDFLDAFPTHKPAGKVVLVDVELDPRMLRRWLRDHGIVNRDKVIVLPLRGYAASLNLLDEQTRSRWAKKLRAVGTSVILLDCMRPILDALGLSEDKDAGRSSSPSTRSCRSPAPGKAVSSTTPATTVTEPAATHASATGPTPNG